mmetsp:Transcript_22728/g.43464  ORF Transcript_22728/g.43464 Transcript_22728/m.43464 type:complete len:98 (-) Transcript_22728:757-1050(-)
MSSTSLGTHMPSSSNVPRQKLSSKFELCAVLDTHVLKEPVFIKQALTATVMRINKTIFAPGVFPGDLLSGMRCALGSSFLDGALQRRNVGVGRQRDI